MSNIKSIFDRIYREPVAAYGLITYGVFLATEYGLPVDAGQQAAILGFVAYALTLYTRQKVTPVSDPKANLEVSLQPTPLLRDEA